MDRIKFLEMIRNISPKNIALVCHHNADPDSFGSAYAVKELIEFFLNDLNIFVVTPGGMSSTSKRLYNFLERINIKDEVNEADLIIMVDTTSFIQLGLIGDFIKNSNIPIMVIDHHEPSKDILHRASYLLIDTSASSTAEIIIDICRRLNIRLSKFSLLALLTAMVFDSKRFFIISNKTFSCVSFLIDSGVDYNLALSILSEPIDMSEKIARLKGMQRLRLLRIKDWLIVFSNVSSFEASLARSLIDVGSDVAIVIGGEGDDVRVSARSTETFFRVTGIHLGRDVMAPLGEFIGGSGGGHSTAAGANGFMNRDKIQDFCTNLFISKLS